VAFGVQKL